MNYFLNQLSLKLVKNYPFLQKYLKVSYGLIPEKLKNDDFVFGIANRLDKKILMPSGDWSEFLPPVERQSGRGVETMACTNFAALNVIETLFKKKFGVERNFSDRFLAKMSGTGRTGNVQSRVLDTIRKVGLVDEQDYPSDLDNFSWDEYYKPISQDLISRALTFVNNYEIGYEAITPTIPAMREALKYSPLYAAGYAWHDIGDVYYSDGTPNHCFMIYNIEQVIAFKRCFDSYEPYLKKLASQYQIYYPKLLVLNKRGESYNSSAIQNLINRGFTFIIRALGNGEIYKLENDKLVYISPEEWNTLNVQMAADSKKLIGISEELFNSLLA